MDRELLGATLLFSAGGARPARGDAARVVDLTRSVVVTDAETLRALHARLEEIHARPARSGYGGPPQMALFIVRRSGTKRMVQVDVDCRLTFDPEVATSTPDAAFLRLLRELVPLSDRGFCVRDLEKAVQRASASPPPQKDIPEAPDD